MDEMNEKTADVGRRAVLRRSAAVTVATPALIGVGTAQTNGTGNGTGNGTDNGSKNGTEGDTVTVTNAAIPSNAPTFGKPDYTGMFIRLGSILKTADTQGIGSCQFFRSDDDLVPYAAILVSPNQNELERGSNVYGRVSDGALEPGRTYTVNNQIQCDAGFVQVQLEEVDNAPRVDEAINNTSGTGGDTGVGTGGGDVGGAEGTTATDTPGFGVGAALAGLATGVGYVIRQSR